MADDGGEAVDVAGKEEEVSVEIDVKVSSVVSVAEESFVVREEWVGDSVREELVGDSVVRYLVSIILIVVV